jgi:hypothetical protein
LHWLVRCLVAAVLCSAVFSAAEAEADNSADIVNKFIASTQAQQETLKGMQMEVQISADLPKWHKTGKMNALRVISRLGKISYKVLGFSGDDTVKNDVIANYLKAETQGQQDTTQYAITPANYKFRYKGYMEMNGQQMHIFELKPRQNRVGLFKGELWLDAKTSMPIRESGHFVKNPSVFLKKVEFVREYEIQDGVAIPKHIQSTVDTRIAGRADISIDYTNVKKAEPETTTPVEEARFAQ